MKRISIIFAFAFIIMIFPSIVQATEENVEVAETDIIVDTVAKVIEAKEASEVVTGNMKETIQEVTIEIIEGDYIGEEFTTNFALSYDLEGKILAYELDKGDKVLVQLEEDANGNVNVTIQDVVRTNYIILMCGIFLFSLLLVGGKNGIKAIIGILLTIIFIYFILIKRILVGNNAIIVASLTSVLIIVGHLISVCGFNKRTLTAILSTLGGIIVTGIVSLIFNNLAKMSGTSMQLSINISSINFNLRDLLFVGIIISAIGACMNVATTIVLKLDEIKMKKPDITWKELLKNGMDIGKNTIIATMSNTLILVYIGSTISLILLFIASDMGFTEILNKESIAEEIIAALSGSIGVIYTIPITAFVYSVLNKDRVIYNKTSENKINGKRSLKI